MRRTRSIAGFRRTVWEYYHRHARHGLPWRKTSDPYKILVSEIMLQQTQVSRVMEKYKEFLRAFPTVRALARAPFADVLKTWSGLGYNRRAKYLHDAAKAIVAEHRGRIPSSYESLRSLPGIGDYTARAVRVFAFNEPDVLIETNIRTAFIHNIWKSDVYISDKEIRLIAMRAAEGQDPRKWHFALMDYGAHLKHLGVRNNHRSAHYVKQSKFEGSVRQVRGAILRSLLQEEDISGLRNHYIRFDEATTSLARDGFIRREGRTWLIA